MYEIHARKGFDNVCVNSVRITQPSRDWWLFYFILKREKISAEFCPAAHGPGETLRGNIWSVEFEMVYIMKSNTIFVILEFIAGFGLGIGGVFLFDRIDNSSIQNSIFFGFIIFFAGMLTGIGTVGYFHLRRKKILHRFGLAMIVSFFGLISFLVLYIFIDRLVPADTARLSLFLPLTGAVAGFNLVRIKTAKNETGLH